MRRIVMVVFAFLMSIPLVVIAPPAFASVTAECHTRGGNDNTCQTGTVPANHRLNRVWIGIEADHSFITVDWEVWDSETGARVGNGTIHQRSFRTSIDGLHGNHYYLFINDGSNGFGSYAFICDC
jgi:hypothetical protein